jgi:hypothetical protein
MKKTLIYIALLSTAFIFMSNRGGRTTQTGQGATTAPGESGQYCGSIGCHSTSTYETDIKLAFTDADGNIVSEYNPGEDYTVNIEIGHIGNPAGYGFQIVSLRDSDDSGINNFFDLPAQTQEASSMNRQYIEQSDRLPNDNISIKWTAPNDGTGDVTFYVAGNAVNGNGSSGGDSSDTTRLTIKEGMLSSVSRVSNDFDMVIYPNPAQDQISIMSEATITKAYIIDVTGKVIKEIRNNNAQISDFNNGLYYVKTINDEGDISVADFIKF